MVLGNCISDHEGNHIRQRHRCRKRSRDLHTTESWLSQSRVVTLIDSLWCFGKKVLDYPNWESRYIRLSMDWISESPSWVPLILLSVIHGLSQEIFARSAKHTPNPELNDSLLDLSWRETSCIYSVDVLTKLYSKSWLMEKAFLSIYQSSSFKTFQIIDSYARQYWQSDIPGSNFHKEPFGWMKTRLCYYLLTVLVNWYLAAF